MATVEGILDAEWHNGDRDFPPRHVVEFNGKKVAGIVLCQESSTKDELYGSVKIVFDDGTLLVIGHDSPDNTSYIVFNEEE